MAKKINYTRATKAPDEPKKAPFKKSEFKKSNKPRPESKKSESPKPEQPAATLENSSSGIRLNRYIAHCGVCSRREADELIANGKIKVNKKLITEMGYKVMPGDSVYLENKLLSKEEYAYVLLNKPKDFITTTKDTHDRKTVMDLVKKAADVRLYPVGRLDRNTTGLLLLTNDGDLAERLSHPSYNIRKIYRAELDKPILQEDFESIKNGITLEDGPVKVDDLAVITADGLSVGIEIHSGKNRIVRRIFEHFGYQVARLDRVTYAGLDKSNLPRGKWRHLTEKEVGILKKKGGKK
jgi:23S rRNA pseudouridine2605 synthase